MTRDPTIAAGGIPGCRGDDIDLDNPAAIRAGYRNMRQLLAPFEAWAGLLALRYGATEWWVAAIRWNVENVDDYVQRAVERAYAPDTREHSRQTNAEIREQALTYFGGRLAALPPLADLVRVRNLVQAAVGQAPSETKTAAIVSATILPFRSRAEAVPLIEATVDLIHAKGYPPAVVAKAKESLLSEGDRKFPPMPGEFQAACEAANDTLNFAGSISDKAMKLRRALEEIARQIEAREPDPEPDPEPEPELEPEPQPEPRDPDEIPF